MAYFTLDINLNYDGTSTPNGVGDLLRKVASRLDGNFTSYEALPPHGELIRDINGNTVGQWSVSEKGRS